MNDFPSIPMTTEETMEFNKWLEEHDKQTRAESYSQGASDMEKAKQIIIDKLLVEIEQIRTEAITDFIKWYCKKYGYAPLEYFAEEYISKELKEQNI